MSQSETSQKSALHRRTVLRVVFFYTLISGLWIFLSDKILGSMISNPDLLTQAQTLKGGLFVALTATLLFFYLRHCLHQLHTRESIIEQEQVKRQQEMAERFNQLRTLFDAINAVVYVADLATYELLFVNRYTLEAFGEDWQGKTCYDFLQQGINHPCDFCNNNRLLIAGEPGAPLSWEFRNTSNQRWYECFDQAIRWTDGRLVRLEIAMDVTERKELEKIKDDLLSAVSHEMRTPLTAICGFTELLKDEPGLPEQAQRHLEIISREADKMTDLVNCFLDARRFKSDRARIDYQYLSVEDLLRTSMEANRDGRPHHEIVLDVLDRLKVYGNRKELVQVFTQLLSNACRYSPQGGQIRLSGYSGDHETVISFSDQGTGIPLHEQENIFKPFHRLDTGDRRRTNGVGMGLTLAREIITLHGGRIELDSTPGQGSRFTVFLPLPTVNSAHQSAKASPADPHD